MGWYDRKNTEFHGTYLILFLFAALCMGSWNLMGVRGISQCVGEYGPDTLRLGQGTITFETPDFILELVKASQTVAALRPKRALCFDFTPADCLETRSGDGFHHLGDLTLRVRIGDSGEWLDMSTAAARRPVIPLNVEKPFLASADLSPTLPANCPLKISRHWEVDDGRLALIFDLKNPTNRPLTIGALGIPMVFNNILTMRSLEEAHEICSFSDPYPGLDAGYIQVTRLNGSGPVLLVVPRIGTPFEAYRPLKEPMRPLQTFEGMFEWLIHSRTYAENEWTRAESWNPATSIVLRPGESRRYGVTFLLSDEIRHIESTLAKHNRPVAVTIPGTILPMDLDGKLFLRNREDVDAFEVEPEGAIDIRPVSIPSRDWRAYALNGKRWGRARLKILYSDGSVQSVHYYITKPSAQAVADLGRFLFQRQWYVDPGDPFNRSPSVMGFDREENRVVLQDARVWIAGLGDEAGSGSWLAAAMKEFVQPEKGELGKYNEFVDRVLWGGIQYAEGPEKCGVRKSMFYYAPQDMPAGYYDSGIDWRTWASWDKKGAMKVDRSYNYPHVAAVYWAMYRIARNLRGLPTGHPWQWYLERAFQTGLAMTRYAGRYAVHGQMGGTIFLKILLDLRDEGWLGKAAVLEATMKKRADIWRAKTYPFGSEMAWDSTGQEEVYAWCKYFGYEDKAGVSLNSILGYTPAIPHWGYNGNARRYWDFYYGGKLKRIERQLHHYGSGLNSIPVLTEYRENPHDYYLLRVGYGGMMGALSNIDQEGFASAAFHSHPSTLRWDAYSGDYGPNFLGHVLNSGTYIINHPQFGWQVFGGNLRVANNTVSVEVMDSLRRRIYIAPLGLWLTLDSGRFERVKIDTSDWTVTLELSAATPHMNLGRLRIENPGQTAASEEYEPAEPLSFERGAYQIKLKRTPTRVKLILK